MIRCQKAVTCRDDMQAPPFCRRFCSNLADAIHHAVVEAIGGPAALEAVVLPPAAGKTSCAACRDPRAM